MKAKQDLSEVKPVVCCVGERYQICVLTSHESLVSVRIGDSLFQDVNNGIVRSCCKVHKFDVPSALLDREGSYTVIRERLIKRQAYRSLKYPEKRSVFEFIPLPQTGPIRIYHLSDCHGLKTPAVKAASFFVSAPDLLILNGDVASSSQTEKEALLPMEIAYLVTKGSRPCIITRGNHDLRGRFAENLDSYYPTLNGSFFYTIDLPRLSFLVLDCGEDKVDDNIEYAGTVAFHEYRIRQTAFIKDVCEEAIPENRPFRFVLSHIPFMRVDFVPAGGIHEFDIELELYEEWVRLMNERFRPRLGLFGHIHQTLLVTEKGEHNEMGLSAPCVFGGRPDHKNNSMIGTAVSLNPDTGDALIMFTNSSGSVLSSYELCL